tara:strand:- start:1978 stop:2211 length:234 start_codon:yes stop_codon:yes gene_type:complete
VSSFLAPIRITELLAGDELLKKWAVGASRKEVPELWKHRGDDMEKRLRVKLRLDEKEFQRLQKEGHFGMDEGVSRSD